MRTFNNIELFAGCGGLALGLNRAGFKTYYMVDFNKPACETLKKNFTKRSVNIFGGVDEEPKVFCEGVEDFAKRRYLLKVDVISGGPPCQTFSYAGKKLGFDDIRGTMFYHYAECLRWYAPKAFVFENVKGLLTHDGGRTFETIRNVLSECGYKLRYKVLDASYYGVPQKRERLILIGFRNNIDDSMFEWPVPSEKPTPLSAIELEHNPDLSESVRYSERLEYLFGKIKQGENWSNHKDDKEIMEYINPNNKKLNGGNTGVLRRASLDAPCPTLLTSPQMKLTQRCHPTETRPFSIREYARIQTFPDDFEFCGSKADQYKQIGNAVPVKLAEAIGLSVRKVLEANDKSND